MAHELNTLSQTLAALTADGYAVVRGHLDIAQVRDLRARTEELWEHVRDLPRRGVPTRDADDRVVYNLQNKDKHYIDLLGHPLVRDIAMAMLNDPYYRFLPPDIPCLLYTSPSPRDRSLSRMPSSA